MRVVLIVTGLALGGAAGPGLAACNVAGTYVAASGDVVKTPRCAGNESAGARYLCGDGSFSHAEHRLGACSRHGGVARELEAGEAK